MHYLSYTFPSTSTVMLKWNHLHTPYPALNSEAVAGFRWSGFEEGKKILNNREWEGKAAAFKSGCSCKCQEKQRKENL